ncbi:Cys-tRNA(Pro) deacylase [Clostridium sp. CS001]|nr:Cys-tRNA(Pro) deacylase [Clostridium sp. CS001]MCB2288209.1 Cys-tRNA(Pro) deacylase [Clostridium sp. CS001]
MKNLKTNAMRIVEKAGISYDTHSYDHSDGIIDGISVAKKIGKPEAMVYKTLVTQGSSKEYYVFVIPVTAELDLKTAARVVSQKSIEMIKTIDINRITGYVRGGCSPIGMKKEYKTVLDISCMDHNTLIISAGKIGNQIELSPKDLISLSNCLVENIIIKGIKN